MIKELWANFSQTFGRAAKIGLTIGAIVIVVATIVLGYVLLRPNYQILFANLSPQDTAAMTAELERLKIPYSLSEQDNNDVTILVDKSEVHKTRIKLMGKDIPLHGTVGFELFNNSDFGMTEFAQKINYQRALQGELTRTILSLAEVRDARVLLALPEPTLFKQNAQKPKASITVTMKQEQRLKNEQVLGIQRLVASAVPSILAQDVTIVDNNGVALTRSAGDGESEATGGSSRLDLKKETEAYLSKKACQVLERALGPNEAMASIDVTLDMDRIQSNTDEVLGAPGINGDAPTGIIVRDRQTSREAVQHAQGNHTSTSDVGSNSPSGSSQSEVEYAVGHRVEQVISQPGSIRKIQVAVVVNRPVPSERQEQIRAMVAASVGASTERGDVVVLHAMEAPGFENAPTKSPIPDWNAENGKRSNSDTPATALKPHSDSAWYSRIPFLVGMSLLLLCAILVLIWTRNAKLSNPPELSDDEKHAALAQVKAWMSNGPARGNS